MATALTFVVDQMEGDTSSEASQEIEETPPHDIIESSKLKLSSDLEKSLEITSWGVPGGMLGADFTLRFHVYPSSIHAKLPYCAIRCHRFMLAARSEVFHSVFMESPLKVISQQVSQNGLNSKVISQFFFKF